MNQDQLIKIRNQIDEIDDQLYELISKRAALAVKVKQLKQGQDDQAEYYRPEREAQILNRIKQGNKSELSDQAMLGIFRDIIANCLALQKRLNIAFLGPKGTFSQAAVERHFGKAIDQMPVESISQIFRETEAQTAHYGVVPIENTISGKVNQTFDSLLASPLAICGEIKIPIHQHLLRNPADDHPIKRIYSHQQSFLQCAQWLKQHMPKPEKIPVTSNAQAAQLAMKEDGVAAIAGELAAQLYGLKVVNHHIEDEPKNITRFIIIGKQSPSPSGDDKTSLLISTPHTPGTLIELIQPFADHGVNLMSIESRPARNENWSYYFFIDLDGHFEDPQVKKAFEQLNKMPIMVKHLGSYPKFVLHESSS